MSPESHIAATINTPITTASLPLASNDTPSAADHQPSHMVPTPTCAAPTALASTSQDPPVARRGRKRKNVTAASKEMPVAPTHHTVPMTHRPSKRPAVSTPHDTTIADPQGAPVATTPSQNHTSESTPLTTSMPSSHQSPAFEDLSILGRTEECSRKRRRGELNPTGQPLMVFPSATIRVKDKTKWQARPNPNLPAIIGNNIEPAAPTDITLAATTPEEVFSLFLTN